MRLIALRHGQASFGTDDYDRLSPLGASQCRQAGRWLARHGHDFATVVRGANLRHRQSLAALAEGFTEEGGRLPDEEVDTDFNEFDHHAVVAAYLAHHPDRMAEASPGPGLARLLADALHAWAQGQLGPPAESWPAFRARTRGAGARLHARAAQGALLLVTSAGVLAQLAAEALGAPDDRAVELNLQIRNAAMVELEAKRDGWRLATWNALPHLADQRSSWTYL